MHNTAGSWNFSPGGILLWSQEAVSLFSKKLILPLDEKLSQCGVQSTDGPQVPLVWSSGSQLIVCKFIIRQHLCSCCCYDFIIYLRWSIKFKHHLNGIPFMPLIWKFLVFLCWAEAGRWGGSLDFMHGSRPEVWSGVVSSPSIASGQNGWKAFKTFSPSLSNHKPQVHCWPAAYNWILLFESKTKINTSHQW